MNKERKERIQAFMWQVNKKYGEGFVGKASDKLLKKVPRIPTGITSLDIATGGGLPRGRTSMIYGEKSGGKTTVAIKWVAEAQRICSNCNQYCREKMDEKTGEVLYYCDCEKGYRDFIVAYMDVEGAYDSEWAEIHGVNNEALLYSKPEYAEQGIDITDAWFRTGDIDAIVIDSLAMLVPSIEIEESTEKDQMGVQARLLNKAARKWNGALNYAGRKFGRRPTLILINQLRQKIGVMFGSPDVKPGGLGQGFITSIEVKLWNGKVEIEDKTKQPLWATKKFKVDKNKVSVPFKSGEFTIVMSDVENKKLGDLMEEEFVYDEMMRLGLLKLEKEGGRIVLIGDQRLNGKGQVVKYWMSDLEAFQEAKDVLMNFEIR